MKNVSLVFVIVLAFGCKKPGADCAKAIDKSMELSKADMQKMPGMDDKLLQKLKDVGLQHCKDDKWSDEARACMSDAKTEVESQACYNKLSHEQQDKMNKAAMAMMTPPSAGSAMGSDMGSASAGSAAGAADTTGGSAGSAAAPN
jgi:hypothetical protein